MVMISIRKVVVVFAKFDVVLGGEVDAVVAKVSPTIAIKRIRLIAL